MALYVEIIDSGSKTYLLNLDNFANIDKSTTNQLQFKGLTGAANETIIFSSDAVRDEIYDKIKSLLSAKNINTLPPQP